MRDPLGPSKGRARRRHRERGGVASPPERLYIPAVRGFLGSGPEKRGAKASNASRILSASGSMDRIVTPGLGTFSRSLRLGLLALAVSVLSSGGCSDRRDDPAAPTGGQAGGSLEPAVEVHLHEKHSSALIAWRQQGVKNRILVHVDADLDLDWLPDETVARIAAAHPAELADLELDPCTLEANPTERFGAEDFLYPAARLGIVREIVWVVPDGTFEAPSALRRLASDVLVGRLQMVGEAEAAGLRVDGRRLRGTLLGVPLTVCTIADLPDLPEPTLLDVDLSFFTSRSALTQRVDPRPWIEPRAFVERLRARGIQPQMVTLSLSTLGGTVPVESRWLAGELQDLFRGKSHDPTDGAARREAAEAAGTGDAPRLLELFRKLSRESESDASAWYVLSRALESAGHAAEGARARRRTEDIDPLLAHAELFEADRLRLNGTHGAALDFYDRYLRRFPRDRYSVYATRRRAECLLRLNRTDEGITALREVVGAAPLHAESRMELGSALRDSGNLDEAIEELGAASRLAPDVASYGLALGSAYLAKGRATEGISELEKAVLRRPCYVQARARLATALARAGRLEEAASHLRVALALQPANPRFRILAQQLERQGVRIGETAPR